MQKKLLQFSSIKKIAVFFKKDRRFFSSNKKLPTITIESVEDPYYFCLFGALITKMSEDNNFRIEQYVPRSFHVNESKDIFRFIIYRASNFFLGQKWVNIYKSYAPYLGYKFIQFNPIFDFIDGIYAIKLFRNIKTADDLVGIKIRNIHVGDLIIDTYLRFKPSPKINLNDLYMLFIMWLAYRSVRRGFKYFLEIKPFLFFTSYSTYLQHGVAVRVALMTGVNVYSFGNSQEFSKKLSSDDFYHTKNPTKYSEDFSKISDYKSCLQIAEQSFHNKISGKIDYYFSYMKSSAYVISEKNIPNVSGACIIFLHDFFDSPHVYPNMVFNDFWEWICFTIDSLDSRKINYFIKPHPNQISLNEQVLANLIHKYPSLKFISSKITNSQLVNAGIASAITVYGSVAHEMAYFGIPSIACARHPHITFSFCQTAKSKEEYETLIHRFQSPQNLDVVKMRRESLEFYFMHNLNLTAKESELMLALHDLRSGCNKLGQKNLPDLVELTRNLSAKEAFRQFCKKIINELPDGVSTK